MGVLLTGCGNSGPEIAPVTGRVTLDGKAFEGARVYFYPSQGGRQSQGATDEEGRYELYYTFDEPGAVVGEHKVTISTLDDSGLGTEKIPLKYNTEGDLTKEVTSGDNEIDLELVSD